MDQSRILIVEDEAIVAMEIAEMLTAMGLKVAGIASSGEQAIHFAGDLRPDLVLMDISLGGDMDGIAAAREIRRRFREPVIFLTAHSEDSTLVRAKRAEPAGFILKPFDDRELRSAIEIALYKHGAEEELRRMNRLYSVLSQVNQAIVRVGSRAELLETVCRLLVERGEMDLAWVGCRHPGTSDIYPVASFGKHAKIQDEAKFYSESRVGDQSNPSAAILEGKPYICNECGKIPCSYPRANAPERFGFHSCASFPLWFQTEVFGALSVCVREQGFFREKEIDLLEEVASDISFALDKIENDARREHAEKSLAESEAKYRNIIENTIEGIFQTTPEGRLISANPALAHMCGFPSPAEMVSSVVSIAGQLYVNPQDRDTFKALLATVGIAKNFETQLRRTDNRLLWVSINAKAVRDERGNLLYYEGTVEDISERRRHERELELAVAFLRLMQEAKGRKEMIGASVAFFKARLDCEAVGIRMQEGEDYPYFGSSGFAPGFILAENSLCAREDMGEVVRDSAGYPILACMCGNVICGRFDPSKPFFTKNGSFWTNNTTQLLATTTEADRQARTRNRCNGEGYESVALIALRAGSERIGLLQLNDRRKDHFSAEDISLCERLAEYLAVALAKFAYQEKLRDSEKQFKTIFEMASVGISETDPETSRRTRVNQKMCEITGYSSEELLQMHVHDLTHPEDRVLDREQFLALASSESDAHCLEKRFLRKDGEPIWVRVNRALIRDSSGRAIRVVSTIEDITEGKRIEKERALAEDQLRQAQKLEALGTLAGGVAHDFNNILSIIMGYTELSRMETDPGSSLGENLQEILNASSRAKDLVQQILAFSRRSEHRKLSLRLDIIVKEAMKILRPSLPSTIEIKTEVLAKSAVLADPTQMHQVLMNLCTNAAHSMRYAGGVLEVRLRDVVLAAQDIGASEDLQPGSYVDLTVKDTGHGIDPEIIDSIFDPFFTTKKQGEGTGLGLSVVHGIVRSHGGAITVESSVGEHTSFRVLIPAVEAAAERKKEEAPPPLLRGKERILIVDDEPALAEMVRIMLSRLGYDAISCTSGVQALKTFRNPPEQKPFDLVVTDMTMPRITGEDLALEISKLRPELPVILMTGFSEMIDAEKAKRLGIKGFLMKPVVLKNLASLIRKLLETPRREA